MVQIERDENYINALTLFIYQQYDIKATSITSANRGYYGETWRIDTADKSFFLKLDYSEKHQIKYRNSLHIVDYLCNQGIDFINRIVKTVQGELFANFDKSILCIFEWIDGKSIETDETKIPEYQMLAKIYSSSKQGFDIPAVMFSNDATDTFFAKWNKLKSNEGIEHNNIMNSIFDKHEKKLYFRAERLSYFANLCKTDYSHFYFTHGDAGGNILVTDEKYYIIDWDEVMYAPPERDAWVMSCREWAINAFNDSLNQNGIDYKLRNERIAFYCYHMFFQYLNELLNDFFLSGQTKEIEEYFDCWIEERIQYADSL